MNNGQQFLDEIRERVLIGDGAIGTALFARGATPDTGVERLNLLAPEQVLQLHRDYVAAGSRVLETNTFSANRSHLIKYGAEDQIRDIILAGVRLARTAAGANAYVAGSVGPLADVDGEPVSRQDATAFFTEQITALEEGGVDLLLLESFATSSDLLATITLARSLTSLPIIAQMAYGMGGYTNDGESADDVATRCLAAGASIVGANCGYGAPSVVDAISKIASLDIPMSAYLNAGFPEEIEGRQFYLATPEYLAYRAGDLVTKGVKLIGGCCGTDPNTIHAIAQAVAQQTKTPITVHVSENPVQAHVHVADESVSAPLAPSPILVELDPPTTLDVAPVLANAHRLKEAGATGITMADNPLASVRVDNLTLASMVQRETGLQVIPHVTGRDRNRIALQSMIMGAHVVGIRSMICVTGDPVRLCQEPNTSGVFDVTSVGLVRLIADFNAGRRLHNGSQTAFAIGVALNPNVRSLKGQIDKLQRKIEAGAHFALTQPIFEEERLDMLQEALDSAGITIPVHIGIMPIISSRNAEFLHNEVPGMRIPDEIRQRLASLDTVPAQRAAGIDITVNLIQRFATRVQGFYLITPRNQIDPVLPLISAAQESLQASTNGV
ncbi:MAG TPA: bifunctional homocysteine S-methyltransferase/methylenetetrahydrofolate reductase [Armatimonadota bacterium]|nr:bifunctional homocysteine S-methyltransferase/methylenetetrahydrofolate reductase [Armatimonadota bacterium]